MSRLGAPGVVAGLAVAAGLVASPLTGLALRLPAGDGVLAALLLLLVAALVARAAKAPELLLATGVLVAASALGYDAVRGHRGTIRLAPGEGTTTFDETGRRGRAVGLRPLGAPIALKQTTADGDVILDVAGQERVLTRASALPVGPYRLGRARTMMTGAARLQLSVTSPAGRRDLVALDAGTPASADGLEISLESYFPDFALDGRQQPFSRSDAPKNPAALLRVRRGGQEWRLFVIRAMPGVHRPEGLADTIRLEAVEPETAVEIAVDQEPAGPLAAVGLLLAAAGLAWSRW